jgi:hypothetical protein
MRNLLTAALLILTTSAFSQVLPSFGNSRTGTTGMQFLKIGVDARSAGMGGAYIASCNDVAGLYWNPACITRQDTQKVEFQVSNTSYFAGINMAYAGATWKVKRQSYLGINVTSLNSGSMKETTEFEPFGTGRTFSVSSWLVGLTYAKVLTSNFSFGLNGKFAHEGIAGVGTNNLLFDLGLHYNIGLKHAKFAVTVSNFGANVKPHGQLQVLKFTGPVSIDEFEEISAPAIFRLGACFDPIHTNKHILTLAAQLNHPTDNNETFSFGAEYNYRKIFFLRSGYEFGADEKGLPSLGAGMKMLRRFGGIRFDYSFTNKTTLGNVHRITLGYALKSKKS